MSDPFRLPPEDYAKLLEAERLLHDALPMLDKAKKIGMSAETYNQWMALHAEAMERISAMKQFHSEAGK